MINFNHKRSFMSMIVLELGLRSTNKFLCTLTVLEIQLVICQMRQLCRMCDKLNVAERQQTSSQNGLLYRE